ncbi:MAG: ATP-dependent DNA helicase RecG [Patescibacteria group bacterium]|nr:ATP-dependent DNA helicase RecG [Patescibacteria group bacterium]
MDLEIPINSLPNTSLITIRRFNQLGIKTYFDLLNYFPFRYEDYSLVSPINKVQPGEVVTLQGQILDMKNEYTKTGLKIQKLLLYDGTAKIEAIWYNQPYLLKLFKLGNKLSLAGEIKNWGKKIFIEPKEYEIVKNNFLIHTGRIIPIYPEKKGLSSKVIREKIFYLLNSDYLVNEFLPEEILKYNSLVKEDYSYKNIHFPENFLAAKKARERLAFDELFVIQLSANLVKQQWQKEKVGFKFMIKEHQEKVNQFIKNLPFILTNAQKKAVAEILNDLSQSKPMNRFLQGDVGSGKTVVAAIACYVAYLNGFQSLLMAPTEILAFQHYQTLTSLFKNYSVKIGLQTSSKKISKKQGLISDFNIIVGTHALIQKKLQFSRVGLVIIDEQHRFGVVQRAALKEKGINPHLLTMTATPIPRTVALTLYNELDLTYIDEMPKGRLPIKTFVIPQEKRMSAYQWIKEKIKNENIQVFIVCPLIEESTVETMKSVKAAKKEYQFLKEKIFPEFKVGLLHGKLKAKEKEKIMNDFRQKKYHLLVTTPVVEVGVDIPNANIIIIEAAERFGLAQLHQLRGRVGRSDKQAYCFLFSEIKNNQAQERLNFFAKNNLGIKLAEYDLKIRGPGDVYGLKQHGYLNLKIASLTDYQLINQTKRAVLYFLSHYSVDNFTGLYKRLKEYQIKQITRD